MTAPTALRRCGRPGEEVSTKERELVHHAHDAAIVGRGDAHVDHLLTLSIDRRRVDPVESEDPGDLVGKAFERIRRSVGPTPADAGHVEVGLGTTMTDQDILNGIMDIEVEAAIVEPGEYVELSLQQVMQTS